MMAQLFGLLSTTALISRFNINISGTLTSQTLFNLSYRLSFTPDNPLPAPLDINLVLRNANGVGGIVNDTITIPAGSVATVTESYSSGIFAATPYTIRVNATTVEENIDFVPSNSIDIRVGNL